MENPKKNNNGAVDDILQELKGEKNAASKPGDKTLDNILAEIGGKPRDAKAASPAKDAAPPQMPQKGAAPAAPPQQAKPQSVKTPAAEPPREAGPARPSAGKSATRTLPDFGAAEENPEPRVGKAAALDRVERDKFTKEEELLSWFDPGAQVHSSKRDERIAKKEQKKQQALDSRQEKRRAKERAKAESQEEPPAGEPSFEELYSEPLYRDAPEERAPAPKKEVAPQRPFEAPWQHTPPPPQQAEDRAQKARPAAPASAARGQVSKSAEKEPLVKPKAGAPASAPAKQSSMPQSPRPAAPRQESGHRVSAPEKMPEEKPKAPPFDSAMELGDMGVPGFEKPSKRRFTTVQILEELRASEPRNAVEKPPRQAPQEAPPPQEKPGRPMFDMEADETFVAAEGKTLDINAEKIAKMREESAKAFRPKEKEDTRTYSVPEGHEAAKVPTAAHTKEFSSTVQAQQDAEGKSLFLDDMVDDKFRNFFGETVIVEREELEQSFKTAKEKPPKRRNKKSRTALITGEFARLAEQAEAEDEEEFEDYNRPQDASMVEGDILLLRTNLTRRIIITAVCAVILIWLSLGFSEILALPDALSPLSSPVIFCIVYAVCLLVGVVINFTTVATGIVGLVGEPTVDSGAALATVAALLQAVLMVVQLLTDQPPAGTLFGGIALLLLTFNAFGKRVRSTAILENFRIASAGFDHSAAYVLDGGHEVAYNITSGLEEEDPSILISRPTALVKGFLRQSFSQRWSDRLSRVVSWVLLAVAVVSGLICYFMTNNLLLAISALAGVFCIAAPLSSTLLSGVPSRLLQQATSKVGAVVPGWSAIEELGRVNVVMAGAKDIFPTGSVVLRGIKTFEKERVDLAILYAASLLVEGCATLRDVFLEVIQQKTEILFKVENMLYEPGRGFSAWIDNNRVVIGNREMLQKHGIDPPSIELEMKYVSSGNLPVYLAVSGRLFAMFIVGYIPDIEVQETLEGLVKSGVSLLVTSEDMNVTKELIEEVYQLPPDVVKVMGKRELELLEPLQAYLPESEGVMTHGGSFASFIGGMRSAAGCAAAERMSGIVQVASSILACVLCLLLVINGGLASLSLGVAVLYQLGWSVLVTALPFSRRY